MLRLPGASSGESDGRPRRNFVHTDHQNTACLISRDTVYHYDTQGRLIAETDPAGNHKREVIYLGDGPVGVVR